MIDKVNLALIAKSVGIFVLSRRIVIVILSIALLLCANHVRALANHTSANTVVIGVEALDYCPILCFENNEPTGLLTELLFKLQQKHYVQYQLMPYAIPRLRQEIANGNIDVKFPDNPAWSKGDSSQFSVAIIPYRDAFFSLSNKQEAEYASIENAAVPPGFYIPKHIRNDITIVKASSIDAMFKLLTHGRIDAVYLNQLVAINYAKAASMNIVERKDYPSDKNFFHFRSINNPAFITQINELIAEDPQILQKLLIKYELH